MESIKVEQFMCGVIMGLALRSTDILPVTVGFAIGYYTANKNIDFYATTTRLLNAYLPSHARAESETPKS